MDKLDKDYKKSCEFWVKTQLNLIEQIKVNIENSSKMVSLHKKNLKISIDQLKHEEKYLEDYKTHFENEL